jgi:hypothetical protein
MAVQPIDLQVLFSRLTDVGREQTAYRETQLQSQLNAARALVEQSGQSGHRVASVRDDEEGPEQVSDEPEKKQPDAEDHDRSRKDEQPAGQTLHDPELGQNIDISG